METANTIGQIRQLVIQAKTEEALKQLLAWVQTAPAPLPGWADTVRSLKAQYRRVKREQKQGTISFENAQLSLNKIEANLLQLLQRLERGEAAPAVNSETTSTTPVTKPFPWLQVGVVTALVLAIGAVVFIKNYLNSNLPAEDDFVEVDANLGDCPTYPSDSEFNIMVLPFRPLRGEQERIESTIKDRLSIAIEKYGVSASVLTRDIDVTDTNLYPSDSRSAKRIGDPCRAKLVIWGTTERTPADALITTTNFRILAQDNFMLTAFALNQNAEVDTLSTISSIATDGILTENIEEAIRLIFGLAVRETGDHAIAADVIQEVCDSLGGVSENPKWGEILADSYIRSNQPEQALATYEAILAAQPDNVEAWERKGYLTYQLGRYDQAASSFTRVLEQDTSNTRTDVRLARASSNVHRDHLYEAMLDFEELETKSGNVVGLPRVKADYNEHHERVEQRKKSAEEELKRNPRDTSALRVQAETARLLGDFETAEIAASNLLVKDPNNLVAIKTLIEVKPMLPDTEKAHELIEQARQRIDINRLRKVQPLQIPIRPNRNPG